MSDVLIPTAPVGGIDCEPRRFTVADLAAMPEDLPSGPVRYELHHGRLITMPPPGFGHGFVEGNFVAHLKFQGEYKGHGKASSGEVGIVLKRNPDHVLAADAVFIANDRLPLKISTEGYLETIPHLVVEVRSKNDTLASLQRKAEEYLQVGAIAVWVVDPINRNVVEYRNGAEPRTFAETDTLTIEDVIPGFSLAVSLALQT